MYLHTVWPVLLRIFTATADNRHPCDNCGALVTSNGGTCGRCLDLPYCKVCKRHLTNYCFDQPNICQVTNKPVCLYYYILSFTLTTFARLTSVVVFFQACTRKRDRRPRVNHAVEHIVTEVGIPTDPTDTSVHGTKQRGRASDRRRSSSTLRVNFISYHYLSNGHDWRYPFILGVHAVYYSL